MMARSSRSSEARKKRARSSSARSMSPTARRIVEHSPPLGTPQSTASEPKSSATQTKKKRPGILSGLHPSQDIIGGMPPWFLEGEDPETPPAPTQSRYTTRGSRSGYKEGVYDMKFHPMDKSTRPKRAAKREQKLKIMSLQEDIPTDEEEEAVVLQSSSGSDLEDSEDDTDDRPPVSTRRSTRTSNNRRSGRQRKQDRPLYDSKRHPMDDLIGSKDDAKPSKKRKQTHQSIESDIVPRNTQRRIIRSSTDTMHDESPNLVSSRTRKPKKHQHSSKGQSPQTELEAVSATVEVDSSSTSSTPDSLSAIPRSGRQSISPLAPSELEQPHEFPEDPPKSMQETMQRIMEVVQEVKKLEPWIPAIQTHLGPQPVQVHEDSAQQQEAIRRAHSRFPISRPDDLDKENLQDATREGSAIIAEVFADVGIMGTHASDNANEEDELARSRVQEQDDTEGANGAGSTPFQTLQGLSESSVGSDIPERFVTVLERFKSTAAILDDPPSTGNTPVNSQVRFDGIQSSRTLVGDRRSSPVAGQGTIKDTHLTVSQSAALEDSQIPTHGPYEDLTGGSSDSTHFSDALHSEESGTCRCHVH